jgi:hypothetical protein
MRALGIGLAILAVATPAAAVTRTYALIVAENHSLDPSVPPLRYADDDGVRNFELFSLFADHAALFTTLDDDTARVHPGAVGRAEVPDHAAILARLDAWNREMEADLARGDEPELFFVYAGHGDVDPTGMGYVSLHDAKLTRADLFREVVAPSKASFVHVLVDACKSYFLVNSRGGTWKDDRAPESHDDTLQQFLANEAVDKYPRVGVIVATSGDQETHEWSRYRGGILSHELRSAMLGAADVNGDGRVEYSELRAFLAAANARVKNPEARLDVWARAPIADRHHALVDLRRTSTARFLHFAPPERGIYHLEDDRGLAYADFNKEGSASFDVALDPKRSYYLRHEEAGDGIATKEAEIRSVKPRKVTVAGLDFHSRALASRGSLEQSFRRDLYQVPFGRGFYDGFVATSGDLPVEGDPAPFLVMEPDTTHHHALSAGYLVSGAPFYVPGALHAVDVRYYYRAKRWLDLGLVAQVGGGSATVAQPSAPSMMVNESITRAAVLASVAGEWRPVPSIGLRLDLGAGWQYASGTIDSRSSATMINLIAGSDPAGFRGEVAAGIVYDISPSFGLAARGGLAIDYATIRLMGANPTNTSSVNYSPLLNIYAIVRL